MTSCEKILVGLLMGNETVSRRFSAQVCPMLASTKPSAAVPGNNRLPRIKMLVFGVPTH